MRDNDKAKCPVKIPSAVLRSVSQQRFKNPMSASSPKQPAPYRLSPPLLAATPLPALPPSRFLSSGHPGTSVLSCPPPSLHPSRGHLVFKLKFT